MGCAGNQNMFCGSHAGSAILKSENLADPARCGTGTFYNGVTGANAKTEISIPRIRLKRGCTNPPQAAPAAWQQVTAWRVNL